MWPRRKSVPFISPCPPAIVMLWAAEYAATIRSLSTPGAERLGARARRAREAVVAAEDVREPLALEHAEHLAEPDDDRHRRREVRLVLHDAPQLLGQVQVVLRQRRGPRPGPRPVAERAEDEARREHEPLLRDRKSVV